MTTITIRKRLGQYFSGPKVANLLVRLCSPSPGDSIIDPMAGVGDMLAAARRAGAPPSHIFGIEIDPLAAARCEQNIVPGTVYVGDAFSWSAYERLGRTSWDLVITNPPYVRYQHQDRFTVNGLHLQSAEEIRRSLERIVGSLGHLEAEEQACLRRIVQNYSGLADLAVPSWLLCASLLRPGGRLAMVVPESWMSRDYALSIKYMLLKLFNIKYIVEDWNSAWFPGAQVKTTLLVAERVPIRRDFDEVGESFFKHIRLSEKLIGPNSLVERLHYGDATGERALERVLKCSDDIAGDGFEIRRIPLEGFRRELVASAAFGPLRRKVEPRVTVRGGDSRTLPVEFRSVISADIPENAVADLATWGFRVGQGLRTGGNAFFYTLHAGKGDRMERVQTSDTFGNMLVDVSPRHLRSAFRYQSDAADAIRVTRSMLLHRLLYIQENIYDVDGRVRSAADAELAKYIHKAENTVITRGGRHLRFPQLSAIKPNIRPSADEGGGGGRHWFMLPPLTNRHMPQLCVARVNHRAVRCWFIADEDVVVDANFATLWTPGPSGDLVHAMLALLNSSWTQAYLESMATVMGGGALKVEASHLRNLLLPAPTDTLVAELARLGESLPFVGADQRSGLTTEIDRVVLSQLLVSGEAARAGDALRNFIESKIAARQRTRGGT